MTQLNVDRRYSIEQMHGQFLNTGKTAEQNVSGLKGQSFAEILEQKKTAGNGELKFSKHAAARLNEREIVLTDSQNIRLENGVKQASEKGIHESLVLVDSLAFIVNVPNRTVVTAMDQTETNSNVFTNIFQIPNSNYNRISKLCQRFIRYNSPKLYILRTFYMFSTMICQPK